MHPDRMGKSKWVKVLPWYYTTKRRASRQASEWKAIREDLPETMFRTTTFDDSGEEELTPVKSWRYIEDSEDW